MGQAAQTEHACIAALPATDTSETRRGMRYGMLEGMLAGTSFAHALTLPYDRLAGTGPALLPATWAHHTHVLRRHAIPQPQPDSCVIYGAPRGFLGPVLAAGVGFVAGSAKVVGMLLGAAVGLVTSPQLLGHGVHSVDFKAHLKHYSKLCGNHGFRLGSAAAALVSASFSDAIRLPSIAFKAAMPVAGLALGACLGSIRGLRDSYPGDVPVWVARCGQLASTTSQQSVVIALGASYLWFWQHMRVDS